MLKGIMHYITDSDYRFLYNVSRGFYHNIPDDIYLKKMFKIKLGYDLDLIEPKTYNEKLQWLKLYDRNPNYSMLVDKYEVKKYVSSVIGSEYIIPTIGVWKRFEDICFAELPDQFVLKCTHDSHGMVICTDKKALDIRDTKKNLEKAMHRNYFWYGREWPYKNVEPRIIAEKYMEDTKTHELRDYKFFCFGGIVKAMFVASDRQKANEETKFDFYDTSFKHLDLINGHPNARIAPDKPENFDKMICLAEKLSEGIPHVRVDFYEVDGRVFFGEMTFFHWSGFTPFKPFEWDVQFGEWINLSLAYHYNNR